MAGYSKGIVDTRKFNKNSKARLGRRGDTKIREVGGRDSHVNALEAYLIDVNGKAGEDYAKRVGAGTVNPLTGMPEYHTPGSSYDSNTSTMMFDPHDDSQHTHENTPSGEYEWFVDAGPEIPNVTDPNTGGEWTAPTGRQDYETLSNLSQDELEIYLRGEFDIGADKMQYIEPFVQEPFGFLAETQTLTTGRAGELRGFAERGLESAYGATMGALGSQEKQLGLQMEGISRTAGRGLRQSGGARATATSRSGLATSGTITQAYETQKKDLFQDYTAGAKGIQIGREDIGRQRGTALEQLTLGKAEAGATEQYAIAGADLDFRKGTYAEQQRQLDELYADITAIPT